MTDHDGGTSQPVAGGVDAVLGQQQHGHGAVDHALGKADAVYQIVPLVDERRHQFGGVDVAVAHLQKMHMTALVAQAGQLVHIVDAADRGNRVGAQMRPHRQGLRLAV